MFFTRCTDLLKKKYTIKTATNLISDQSGNIFFALFGAVIIVGLLGSVVVSTMRGPLSTMVQVQTHTQAESEMAIASRLALMEATQLSGDGDCDLDGFVEPLEYTVGAGPSGGGFLPNEVGSARIDPWGTDYGYCAWDAGGITNDAACELDATAGNQRLNGNANPTDDTYTVIAVISAGPDQTFDSSCNGGASPSVSKGGDDIVVEFTYATARASTNGLWNIKSGEPNVAEINKEIEVSGNIDLNIGGVGTGQLVLGAASMLYPTQAELSNCNGANENLLRVNTSADPDTLEICNESDSSPGVYAWESVAAGAGAVWSRGIGDDIFYNDGTPQVGIGTTSPDDTLDVVGTFDLSGAATLGSTLNVTGTTTLADTNVSTLNATGAVDFDSTLNVDGATTLDTLNATGAVDFDSTLNVDGNATVVGDIDAQANIRNTVGEVRIADNLIVTGTSDFLNDIRNTTAAPLTIADDLEITGTTDTQGSISNSTGNVNISDNLDVSNDLDVTGNIAGTDITASSDLSAGSTVMVNGDQLGPPLNCTSSQKLEWNNGVGWSCVTDLQGGSGGGAPAMDDITDVSAASPNNGDCLVYNNISGDWESGSCSGTGAGIFEVDTSVIRVKSTAGDYATDDFVVGSPQLADDGDTDHDNRMFFDKSKAAFRVGATLGSEWNDTNVGTGSIVLGLQSTASDTSSIAIGIRNTSSGQGTIALGSDADATSTRSIAIGNKVISSGTQSMAIGLGGATGTNPTVSGASSLGVFMGNQGNVNLTSSNTFGVFGGKMIIDPNVPATQTAPSTGGEQDLELDVEGDIGAMNYCDENGDNCFTAATAAGAGIWTDLGADRIYYGTAGNAMVGIATNNPQTTLDVNGSVRIGNVSGVAAPSFMALNDLSDVDAASPSNNDCIIYNNTSGNWESTPCSALSSSIWTDNTTYVTRENFHILDTGQTPDSVNFSEAGGGGTFTGVFYHPDKQAMHGGIVDSTDDATDDAIDETNIGIYSFAWGRNAEASGFGATAFGRNTTASGLFSFVAGQSANSSNVYTVALGDGANASGDRSVAIKGWATGDHSLAIKGGTATGVHSMSIGGYSNADADYSSTFGNDVQVATTGTYSIGIGVGNNYAPSIRPSVAGANALGIFMGANDGVVFNRANTMGIFNGEILIDDDGTAGSQGCIRYLEGTGLQYSNDCLSYASFGGGALSYPLDVEGETTIMEIATGNVPVLLNDGTHRNFFAGEGAGENNDFSGGGAEGRDNTYIGYDAGTTGTTAYANTVIGSQASLTDASSHGAIVIGQSAQAGNEAVAIGGNAPGNHSIAIGRGSNASSSAASGHFNIALGYGAGTSTVTGFRNIMIGDSAGNSLTSATSNVFIGSEAGRHATSSNNTLIGHKSGQAASGSELTGANNTFVGYQTGLVNTSGANNVFIGDNTGDNNATGSRNILIGSSIDNLSSSTDDSLNIGNTIYGDLSTKMIGIGTPSPAVETHVYGTSGDTILAVEAPNSDDSALALYTTGDGASWGNANARHWQLTARGTTHANTAERQDMLIEYWNGTAWSQHMYFDTAGYVGINNTTPNVALDVNGDIEYTGSLNMVSDKRLKENIMPFGSALAQIEQIKTYRYNMKADEDKSVVFGVMAQELENIYPELVNTANDDMKTKSVNYIGLIAPMIEATKELRAENTALRAELASIKTAQADTDMQLQKINDQLALLNNITGQNIGKKASMQPALWLLLGLLMGLGSMVIVQRHKQNG